MRMPCIARWPNHVPANRECRELSSMLDILPTLAALTGAALPGHAIDGHDIRPLLFGEAAAQSPTDQSGFFYYHMDQLQAVRSGPWKLYLPLETKRAGGAKRLTARLQLFNVVEDVGETHEVSAANPETVQRLLQLADQARAELGDENRAGKGQRPAGLAARPTARVKE
jgi:arylsulfatase A-like enzyme